MKYLIIGSDGQLGSDFVHYFKKVNERFIAITHKDIEIGDINSVNEVLSKIEFDVLINTAAYHAKVAYKDNSPKKHYEVNAFGPYYLAKFSETYKKTFIHYSTDYVFSGNKSQLLHSFTEDEKPIPTNLYGTSKLAGESLVQTTNCNYFLFRVSSVYGISGCKAKGNDNFVEMVIRKYQNGEKIEIIDDILMSPTSTEAIVEGTLEAIKKGKSGLYHLAGSGSCSWYQFSKKVFEYMRFDFNKLVAVKSSSVSQGIDRGKNTSLSNKNMEKIGYQLKHWKYYLKRYIKNRNK